MRIVLSPRVTLYHGDCRDALHTLPDNSVDSVPCDPPYELNFMGKGWDDTGIANDPALWAEVFRVLKPGGHLAAFSASRTYHRMACAIEDAGFEIRDSLMWIYGTGFPKSLSVGKAIDAAAGAEGVTHYSGPNHLNDVYGEGMGGGHTLAPYEPATPAAQEWEGWGTALKPAFEPIVLARKPLSESTVAANVLRWRTGALNIGACRVPSEVATGWGGKGAGGNTWNESNNGLGKDGAARPVDGRWPANVVHDGSDEVVGMFPNTNGSKRGVKDPNGSMGYHGGASGLPGVLGGYDDAGGSAARFFYSAKASKADRNGSKHPTVKPIALMQWLARLITPPGGTVLDPFAGSGTTGAAAQAEGFAAILCERESEYVADIRRRFGGARLVVDLDALRREAALLPTLASLRARLRA